MAKISSHVEYKTSRDTHNTKKIVLVMVSGKCDSSALLTVNSVTVGPGVIEECDVGLECGAF